jgi:mannose/cellobiose epimerase-like protein (N-acyl-D-glucosamine 2-epimerase family)
VDSGSGTGRALRRVGYLPRTLGARWGARPGPTPTDDRAWADILWGWVERQAEQLAADVTADHAGRAVRPTDIVARARRLWTLAHLNRHGIGGDAVAEALPSARAMVDRHADPDFGGYLWSVGHDAPNDQKLLYGQTVVVHALAELALADPAAGPAAMADAESALALATGTRTTGGRVIAEFVDRRWERLPDGSDTKMGVAGRVTIGGQLHLVEAVAVLVAAGGSDHARAVGRTTADILHDRFLAGPDHPDQSWTDERGEPLPEPASLGHKVEAAWILADAAGVLDLTDEGPRARRWIEEALRTGFRHGGLGDMPYSGFRPGGQHRSWWVQAELLRALVEIDRGPDASPRGVMRQLLRWLHRHQVDPRAGQARQLMTHRGLVLVTGEGTTARTGYHDVRAYVAAARLLGGHAA